MSDLKKMILDRMGQQMQESFDFVIQADILATMGWTELEVVYVEDQTWAAVKEWAGLNFEGDHREHHGTWLIENAKDATMFALKWKVES